MVIFFYGFKTIPFQTSGQGTAFLVKMKIKKTRRRFVSG
jgi:hypothetical protein